MNFVSEFLSFMAWLMARPRRSLEVLGLWVYLFIKNNAAAVQDEDGSWYWPVWFEVDSSALRAFMDGISSKRLWELRQELIRYSRLEYQKASGGAHARYALIPSTQGCGRYAWVPQTIPAAVSSGSPPRNAVETRRDSTRNALGNKTGFLLIQI